MRCNQPIESDKVVDKDPQHDWESAEKPLGESCLQSYTNHLFHPDKSQITETLIY